MRSPPAAKTLLFSALGALLVLHAAYYWPFLSDDALISLSYARRWIMGHGLTWTTGERVEGSLESFEFVREPESEPTHRCLLPLQDSRR